MTPLKEVTCVARDSIAGYPDAEGYPAEQDAVYVEDYCVYS